MAESRPFASQYKGQSISPVPAGYIEAYSRIGQGMAETGRYIGEKMGKGIADAIDGYTKGAVEMEAQDAIAKNNASVWNDEMISMYGEGSKEYQDWLGQSKKFSTMSLSQKKAWNATNLGRGEAAKRAVDIEAARTIRTRNAILDAQAAALEAPKPEVPAVKVGETVFNNEDEVDASYNDLKRQYAALEARAAQMGTTVDDPSFARELEAIRGLDAKLNEAKTEFTRRRTIINNRTAKAEEIGTAASALEEMRLRTAETDTGLPAEDKVDRSKQIAETTLGDAVYAIRKTDGSSAFFVEGRGEISMEHAKNIGLDPNILPAKIKAKEQPSESIEVAQLRKRAEMLDTVASGGFYSQDVDEQGNPRNRITGSPSRKTGSTFDKDIIAAMREAGIDPVVADKERRQAERKLLEISLKAAQALQSDDATDKAIAEADKNTPFGAYILSVIATAGVGEAGRRVVKNALAELARKPKNLLAAGYASRTAAKFIKDFPTLGRLYKVADVGKSLARGSGAALLAEVGAEAAVAVAMGFAGSGTFGENLGEYGSEKWAGIRDSLKSDEEKAVAVAQRRLEAFDEDTKADEKVRETARTNLTSVKARLDKLLAEEKANKPAAVPVPKPDLTIPYKELAAKLNKGETVEFSPFSESGELSPLLRILGMQDPAVNATNGAFDFNRAAQTLSETFNVNVEVDGQRLVLKPHESPPVIVKVQDISSARNADEAGRIQFNNYVVELLQARGIPPTPDNVEFVASGGLRGNRKIEWTGRGILATAPTLTEADRLEVEKKRVDLQQARLNLGKIVAETQAPLFGAEGTIQANPDGTVNAQPRLWNKDVFDRNPENAFYVRSTRWGLPKEQTEQARKTLSGVSQTIQNVTIDLPDRMRRLGVQHTAEASARGEARVFSYVNPDGTINGKAIAENEQALQEYVGQMFRVVRAMGEGLGPLSQPDYVFLFAQAGIPVRWEDILKEKGDYLDRGILGAVMTHARGNPNFLNNSLDAIIVDAKTKAMEINQTTNGAIQVAFGNKAVDAKGNIKPYSAEVSESIRSALFSAPSGAENKGGKSTPRSLMGQYVAMIQNPEKFVNHDDKYRMNFDSREKSIRYGLNALSAQTGWPPEYIMRFIDELKTAKK